jgi:hypothetical protein
MRTGKALNEPPFPRHDNHIKDGRRDQAMELEHSLACLWHATSNEFALWYSPLCQAPRAVLPISERRVTDTQAKFGAPFLVKTGLLY